MGASVVAGRQRCYGCGKQPEALQAAFAEGRRQRAILLHFLRHGLFRSAHGLLGRLLVTPQPAHNCGNVYSSE
jgi:hypothetical protein